MCLCMYVCLFVLSGRFVWMVRGWGQVASFM
jgi:hypothetical protein